MLWAKLVLKNPVFLAGLVVVGIAITGLFFSMIGGPQPQERERKKGRGLR